MDNTSTLSARESKGYPADDEAEIRILFDQVANAVRDRDVEGILAAYSPEVVAYDVRDALCIDFEGLRKNWEECFESSKSFSTQLRDLQIAIDGNLAFAHFLSHATGEAKEGGDIDIWLRGTSCFKKDGDKWLVVHEHVSAPGDFMTGKVLQDLKPDGKSSH